MKKHKHYDKDHLYDCPMCSDHALYVHDHKTVECKGCNLRGNLKKFHDKKILHVTINGVMYSVEPEKAEKKEDEEICLIIDNELICVDKDSH